MKNKLLLFFLLFPIIIWGQDSLKVKKANKIIYGEFTVGGAFLKDGGFYIDGSINYQKNQHLFKFSIANALRFDTDAVLVSPIIAIPYFKTSNETISFSLLYGRRHINEGFSYGYAGGISLVNSKKLVPQNVTDIDNLKHINSTHIGFPLEFNIKWFKKNKRRFRILYGIIPVGKPTSFGRSIGFKAFANISKTPYFGLGLTFGLGNHKIYK